MSEPASKALAPKRVWSLEEAKERAERKALRVKKRQTTLAAWMTDLQLSAVSDVRLRKYIHCTDEELDAVKPPLTKQQKAKIRSWELPKRHVPFALEASSTYVTSMLRRETETGKGPSVHIENMTVKLPEKGTAGLPEPITITVEPSK